jgi:hypothetical protein
MPVVCTPQALQEAGREFCCIPAGIQPEVIIYLLNVISDLNLTPQQLMDNAACYRCIPKGMQAEVQTYLLCQIANAAGA